MHLSFPAVVEHESSLKSHECVVGLCRAIVEAWLWKIERRMYSQIHNWNNYHPATAWWSCRSTAPINQEMRAKAANLLHCHVITWNQMWIELDASDSSSLIYYHISGSGSVIIKRQIWKMLGLPPRITLTSLFFNFIVFLIYSSFPKCWNFLFWAHASAQKSGVTLTKCRWCGPFCATLNVIDISRLFTSLSLHLLSGQITYF